ncbi:MAG: hypothetical protein OXH16_00085 [Gemmatimonadetes bacterium]|nr:hypothetical protein [Gemmatimonadota bacterium]MCY3872468.1 hypothetical protein [Gemmatimonadota bacterium]MYC12230.1 hypothetical protein [Gemmatimonadota bacterium]MYD62848.1 hypothetical protein [Gemmatimonadota bacterium]MYF72450.1 hypothetical protein [Gemmatimonadota bacterium]
MQTWKDVFRRKEELQNLKNIGFCFLIVVILITGSYALTGLRDIFQVSLAEPTEWEITATPDDIDE